MQSKPDLIATMDAETTSIGLLMWAWFKGELVSTKDNLSELENIQLLFPHFVKKIKRLKKKVLRKVKSIQVEVEDLNSRYPKDPGITTMLAALENIRSEIGGRITLGACSICTYEGQNGVDTIGGYTKSLTNATVQSVRKGQLVTHMKKQHEKAWQGAMLSMY